MADELVPFGKHKGQPVEVLLADAGYREWLLGQPWVKDRYPTFHQTIINYGGEAAETPEHNEMQASFLADSRCVALGELTLPGRVLGPEFASREALRTTAEQVAREYRSSITWLWTPTTTWGREFENGGWDITFTIQGPSLAIDVVSLPPCVCVCDHEALCPGDASCRGGDGEYGCRHRNCESRRVPTMEDIGSARPFYGYAHCNSNCPWHNDTLRRWFLADPEDHWYSGKLVKFGIECKPDLGDDFPAVLRQVKSHGDVDKRVVVVRRADFEAVTWADVVEIFRASRIILVAERDIDNKVTEREDLREP